MKKTPLTYKKLQEKVFHLILLDIGVLYNILKVYQNRTGGKVFFSRWPPFRSIFHLNVDFSGVSGPIFMLFVLKPVFGDTLTFLKVL